MVASRKRQRSTQRKQEEIRAECPFSITYPGRESKKPRKKKRTEKEVEDESRKALTQLSPFTPTGKFATHDNMDIAYIVEPHKMWQEMTRYNSFVLNGHKYHSEGFIFVANDSTIERQRQVSKNGTNPASNRTDDEWVARILEIRASDEHHVYARVYWMYWPDEVPHGTLDSRKFISGRQSYHGQTELIASNHMDVINVVSVTAQAFVNQWLEENDDEVQDALYWRQGFDFRTMELSTVELVCSCNQPANPDKTLIGCTDGQCHKWLHVDCIIHDSLMKTYREYGRDKAHVTVVPPPKKDEQGVAPAFKDRSSAEDGATHPLSPEEAGGAKQTIDVKSDSGKDGEEAEQTAEDIVDAVLSEDGLIATTPNHSATARLSVDHINPAELNPNPTNLDPSELDPSGLNSSGLDPTELDTPDLTSTDFHSPMMSPSEFPVELGSNALNRPRTTESSASTQSVAGANPVDTNLAQSEHAQPVSMPIMPKPTAVDPNPKPIKNGRGRPRKRGNDDISRGVKGPKPYLGYFTARLNTEASPPIIEITDLRKTVVGDKTWDFAISCLVCGKPVE